MFAGLQTGHPLVFCLIRRRMDRLDQPRRRSKARPGTESTEGIHKCRWWTCEDTARSTSCPKSLRSAPPRGQAHDPRPDM